MEAQPTGLVSRDNNTVREVIDMPNPGSDSVRSTAAYPPSRNRFAVLMEIVSSHHTFLKVHSMYGAAISAMEQAVKQKDELHAFFRGKDAEYRNLSNSSPEVLTTIYLGAIDYKRTGDAGGNAAEPWRKILQTNHEMGWGPGIFKLDGYGYVGTTTTQDRSIDYTHYPELRLKNVPQYPIKMGAFYVVDPRATSAVNELMRHGIEVYKLKNDVTLPNNSTFKFCGPNGSANWYVTKNTTLYVNIYSTKVPRTRAEIRDNFGRSLTDAQMYGSGTNASDPDVYMPEAGGGDWIPAPAGHVAKAGYYLVPTAQKLGRLAGFKLEPRANCGLLFWGHFDDAVGLNRHVAPVANQPLSVNFNLDLVKTFDYSAIPSSALESLSFAEDRNEKPNDTFTPPYPGMGSNFLGLTDAGANLTSTVQDGATGKITITVEDACLYDGMWLTFFFYDENGKNFGVLGQVFESGPGTVKAVLGYEELISAGLVPGKTYFIHYGNEIGDICGYGTLTKGALAFTEYKEGPQKPDPDERGCNASYAAFAFFLIPFFMRRRG
jgi:hypothetical protein